MQKVTEGYAVEGNRSGTAYVKIKIEDGILWIGNDKSKYGVKVEDIQAIIEKA